MCLNPPQATAMLCAVDTWETAHAKAIGKKIKELRGGRPASWLAEATEELGLKLTRQTLTDLENGRRRYVTTAELIVLAAALGVPAVALIYPNLPDGEVEMFTGQHVSSIVALLWFTGELDVGESRSDLAKLVDLSRQLFWKRKGYAAWFDYVGELFKQIPDDAPEEGLDAIREKITASQQDRDEIRELQDRIREIPGSVILDE